MPDPQTPASQLVLGDVQNKDPPTSVQALVLQSYTRGNGALQFLTIIGPRWGPWVTRCHLRVLVPDLLCGLELLPCVRLNLFIPNMGSHTDPHSKDKWDLVIR